MTLRLLLLLSGLAAAPLLPGAEPDFTNAADAERAADEAAATPAAESGTEAAADAGTEPAPATRAPGEDFVPSVQISEDLSVSFPTDI